MNSSQKVTIYSAETKRQPPLKVLIDTFKELPAAHELGFRLFKRNIKAMYRQSVLGLVWAIFPPLVTAGIWILLRSGNVMSMGETAIPYAVFVLTGTMLWQIFTEAVMSPLRSVTVNRAMLTKINIPRTGLLLSGLYEIGFNTLIKAAILLVVLLYFQVGINSTVVWVPLGVMSIIIIGFSIGLLITPIGMLFKDIQSGVAIMLPFMMYLTPVIYPYPKSGIFARLMEFNPLAIIIPVTRNWLTGRPVLNFDFFIIWAIAFTLLLLVGLIIYRLAMPIIIERIGS